MKPQTQPASSPQPRAAARRPLPSQTVSNSVRSNNSPRAASPRRVPTRAPRQAPENLDFYELRQARISEEADRVAHLRLVPEKSEKSDLSPTENQKFERLVDSKTDLKPVSEPVRAKRAKTKAASKMVKAPCAPCHWGLLVSALLLTVLSIPLVYSASTAIALDQHDGNPDFFLTRQISFAAVGFLVMILASRLSSDKLRCFSWILYGVAVLGLVATKFTPLGFSMGNTERWVKIGPLTLQFSELAKIALIGVMADFWSRAARGSLKSMVPWLITAVLGGVPLVLTFMQPHLSAALVLFAIPVAIAFFAGAPSRHFGVIFGGLAIVGVLAISLCKTGTMPLMAPYQQQRMAAHFGGDSKTDAKTSDYQQLQGERALIRGGVKGVGLGASIYKNSYLPAAHTDFIYAVIGEEWGLFGTLGVIGLYGAIVFFCFQTGHSATNSFDALVCAGVGTLLGMQAAGNIGVVSGLLPVTGMPLPILTYGGSGLICALLGIGFVLSVSRAGCQQNYGPI